MECLAKPWNGRTALNYEYMAVLYAREPHDHAVYNPAAKQNNTWYGPRYNTLTFLGLQSRFGHKLLGN